MRFVTLSILVTLSAFPAQAQSWMQWAANQSHQGNTDVAAQRLERIEAEVVLDPFVEAKKAAVGGSLLVHYPVPLIDGDDVVIVTRGGNFTRFERPETQVWIVTDLRRSSAGDLATRWTYPTDWKPVPMTDSNSPTWEPVYHVVMTADAVWAPGAGGTIDKLSRRTGAAMMRVNPFGSTVDKNIYVTGPPTADSAGNIYYNAMQLDATNPFSLDPKNSWLVKVAPDGTSTEATFASLTRTAPQPNDSCTTQFPSSALPLPPAPDAVAPAARCGAQRPGINIAPAIAPDGTIYTVSRAHLNQRWGFLVAANPDLTPKWAASMRNRFLDGCGVLIPPNGTPGGCSAGAMIGIDPTDNQPGSGRVTDISSATPMVLPDGNILYGAQTAYNYLQGHLMMFSPSGDFLRGYRFGWDITPAVYRHDGTYSIIIKENRYNTGSYCFTSACPPRNASAPSDPEQYFITELSPRLEVEWQFRSTETMTCRRDTNGIPECSFTNPNGFEWCVNALAVDRNGVIYANSEDGYVYAIDQRGNLLSRLFLRTALGAAYTPLAIGNDGRIYTQNDGRMYVVTQEAKKRAVKR